MIVAVHLPRLPLLVAMLRARRPLDMAAALAPAQGAPQVVGLCTDAAEAEGVRPGLRVGEAYARCPHLALIPSDPQGAIAVMERLLESLEDAGFAVQALGPEDVAFDSRPLLRLHGGPDGVLTRVRRAVPVGADGRIGVAPGMFAACRAARGRAAALERLGFDGIAAWNLARGEAGSPPRPRTPPQPVSAHIDFADPADTVAMLRAGCRLLLERVAATVRTRGRLVRTLTLTATLADGGSWAHRLVLREATVDRRRLELVVDGHLQDAPGAVTRMRILADTSAAAGGHQLTALPSPREEREARTHEAVRHVRAALGEDALLRVIELEPSSHIPERRFALAPHPEPPDGRA